MLFHDKESRGALAYLALAGEMIRRDEDERLGIPAPSAGAQDGTPVAEGAANAGEQPVSNGSEEAALDPQAATDPAADSSAPADEVPRPARRENQA